MSQDPLVLHQQLLDRIAEDSDGCEDTSAEALVDALRAVVELHRPVSIGLTRITDGQDVPMCKACSFGSFSGGQPLVRVGWSDCLTIRKIAEGLGVHLD